MFALLCSDLLQRPASLPLLIKTTAMTAPISLAAFQGQVLRIRGVVDRFGGYDQNGAVQHTLCIRELRLAHNEQRLEPEHWWFKLRAEWCGQPLQPGDQVLFTAKVAHCHKSGRGRVVGFGGQVRDLVVTSQCRQHQQLLVNSLQEQMQRQALLRQEAEAAALRLEQHRDALLRDLERLRGQLATWKARCQILDPSLSQADLPRSPRGCRHGRGFQHVDRLELPRQRRRTAVASFA